MSDKHPLHAALDQMQALAVQLERDAKHSESAYEASKLNLQLQGVRKCLAIVVRLHAEASEQAEEAKP